MQDIGSGNCAVHNTLLLDHPQKSVVWAPWRYRPPPFWEPFNRNVRAGTIPQHQSHTMIAMSLPAFFDASDAGHMAGGLLLYNCILCGRM